MSTSQNTEKDIKREGNGERERERETGNDMALHLYAKFDL